MKYVLVILLWSPQAPAVKEIGFASYKECSVHAKYLSDLIKTDTRVRRAMVMAWCARVG